MDAQATRLRHGINEPRKGRPPGESVVVANGQMAWGYMLRLESLQQTRHPLRFQTGAVHQPLAAQDGGLMDTYLNLDARRQYAAASHRGVQRQQSAGRFQISKQRGHQLIAVHDARRGGQQRRAALNSGLQRLRLAAAQPAQIGHAIGRRLDLIAPQRRLLPGIGGDDQLAQAFVLHAVGLAVGVQQRLTGHAKSCLGRARRVIDTGVHDLGVATGDLQANGRTRLQQHHLRALQGQLPGHREPDHAGANHHCIDRVHHSVSMPQGQARGQLLRARTQRIGRRHDPAGSNSRISGSAF